jgi:hypothetical protein
MDQSDLIVFPNPTSGQFIVLNAAGYQELQIRNAQGQVLQSADLIIGENTVQLDFPFSDGIYYLYLQSETGIRTIKLLVTK